MKKPASIIKITFESKKPFARLEEEFSKVEELKRALVEGNRRTIENLLGYPETSIESSLEGRVLEETEWWESLPQREKEDLLQEGVLDFINFPLSKAHWQEELEVARRRQAKIKEKAMKLYSEILEQKPKVAMSKKGRKEQEKREIEKNKARSCKAC